MSASRAPSAGGTGSAADFIPPRATLSALRDASRRCRGCRLYRLGTQTVFGEGPRRAALMIVGEQPGDVEDREGKPFVGPSGALLDRALAQAGIAREEVYLTNAVKHFKWEQRGKGSRRIHAKPTAAEARACRPWLEHEIALVKPDAILCLGATAAQSLLGRDFRVTASRGRVVASEWARATFATVHPSAVLRAPREQRAASEKQFFADLAKVAKWMAREGLLERAATTSADHERPLRRAHESSRSEKRIPRRHRAHGGLTEETRSSRGGD